MPTFIMRRIGKKLSVLNNTLGELQNNAPKYINEGGNIESVNPTLALPLRYRILSGKGADSGGKS